MASWKQEYLRSSVLCRTQVFSDKSQARQIFKKSKNVLALKKYVSSFQNHLRIHVESTQDRYKWLSRYIKLTGAISGLELTWLNKNMSWCSGFSVRESVEVDGNWKLEDSAGKHIRTGHEALMSFLIACWSILASGSPLSDSTQMNESSLKM